MRLLLSLFFLFISEGTYCQVIFNNYYAGNNSIAGGWYFRGKDLFQQNDKYYYLHSDSGLFSVNDSDGLNATIDLTLSSVLIYPGSSIKYDVLDYDESNNLFFGVRERFLVDNSLVKSDAIVVKTDANYNVLWNFRLSNDTISYQIKSIKSTPDGGCVIGGDITRICNGVNGYAFCARDGFLLRLSSSGTMDWINEYNSLDYSVETSGGNIVYAREYIDQIALHPNGTLIAVGKIDRLLCSVGSLWVSCFDLNGNLIWEQFVDPTIQPTGLIRNETWIEDLLIHADDIYIVGSQNLGYTNPEFSSYLVNEESYLLKLSSGGNILSDTLYYSYGTSSTQSISEKNNELYVVRRAYSPITDNDDVFISKLHPDLSLENLASISNSYCGSDVSESIFDSQGNLVFIGNSGNQAGCLNAWLVKFGFSSVGMDELSTEKRKLVKVINTIGQETEIVSNSLLLFIYDDGSIEKVIQRN